MKSNIREYSPCSNHGSCDKRTGLCKCDAGWKGHACDDDRDNGDVQTLSADGPMFAGNVLKLKSNRQVHDEFGFIHAVAGPNEDDIFHIAGNVNIHMVRSRKILQLVTN